VTTTSNSGSVPAFGRTVTVRSESASTEDELGSEGRFPFEAWPTDQDFLVTMDLPIAGDAPEGPVDLLIGLYPDGDAGQRLEAVDGSGNRLSQDAFRLPAAVTIRKAAASPDADAGSTGFGAAMARPGAGPGAGLLGIPGWPR
jgi:hypothetical protein